MEADDGDELSARQERDAELQRQKAIQDAKAAVSAERTEAVIEAVEERIGSWGVGLLVTAFVIGGLIAFGYALLLVFDLLGPVFD